VNTTTVELQPLRLAGAGMLGVAAVRPLLPSTPGWPCPLRTFTGIPCPFCGMTRGVTAAMHGDFGASLVFNPGAIVLIVLAVLLLVAWRRRSATIPVWVIFGFFAVLWAYQLFKYATGRPL
jgi:uncharacterized protein DUF2752